MTRTRPVIAIDGPVGAGKSSAARALARALGYTYLNTGAMYRAVAIAAREAGIAPGAPDLEQRLAPLLAAIRIDFADERLLLGGRDVSAQALEPAIGDLASRLSALGAVRSRMREMQRAAGEQGGVVMEGRDIGTVVFPDAEFKFYLDADVMERARRRHAELKEKGTATSLEEVAAQLRERDARDSGRELAPLRAAPDAVVIDSTGLSLERVVNAMKTRIVAGINDRKGLKRT
jgi:cytidylate kinase